jgi:hypothetical protein
MHFTSFSQTQVLLTKPICKEVPRGFDSLQKHPWFALRPSEGFGTLQCGPWGGAGGGPVEFRRARRRSWPEKQWGRSTWSHRCDLGMEERREWRWRASNAASGGGGRRELASGEAGARPRSHADRDAQVAQGEEARGVGSRQGWPEEAAPHWQGRWALRRARGGSASGSYSQGA